MTVAVIVTVAVASGGDGDDVVVVLGDREVDPYILTNRYRWVFND